MEPAEPTEPTEPMDVEAGAPAEVRAELQARRLDAMIDAMSKSMGCILSMRDCELQHGERPLGQMMHDEREHAATRSQLDALAVCMEAIDFTVEAYRVSNEIRSECGRCRNIVLTTWGDEPTFRKCWRFTRNHGNHGNSESVMTVGGVRSLVFFNLCNAIHEWLTNCDLTMMMAFNDTEGDDSDVLVLHNCIEELAERIARRLSLEEDRVFDDSEDLTRRVTSKSSEEISKMSPTDRLRREHDLLSLKALEALARCGPLSDRGKQVLNECLDLVNYVLNTPAQDLCIHGANAAQSNLELLRRACDCRVDPEVRSRVVLQWWTIHGSFAALAVQQAIQTLELGSSLNGKPMVKVLQHPEDPVCEEECYSLPPITFVEKDYKWKFVHQTQSPVFLGWMSRRICRISTMVAQLLDSGTFERGVVASRVVGPIATMSVVEAQVSMGMLKIKRSSYTHGTHLIKFCEDVIDNESHLRNNVSESLICLSQFSMHEITAVMDPSSKHWLAVAPKLTELTKKQLTFKMPDEYVGFAQDAMPIIFKALQNRRSSLGITALQTVSPIQQLLNLMPKVRAWNPLGGRLELYQKDLENAPDLLVMMLKEMSSRRILCEYKRPYLGEQRHAPKKAFVFHTPSLVGVLQGKRISV